MLLGQDIVILVGLLSTSEDWTVRSLGESLEVDPTAVHRGLKRLQEARLYDPHLRRINLVHAEEFLIHGLKYIFPPEFSGETRGVPTAWAAPPLADQLANDESGLDPVWPHPQGQSRGIALTPIYKTVPELALRNPNLGERLALIDAIRAGDTRVRKLAAELLTEQLMATA